MLFYTHVCGYRRDSDADATRGGSRSCAVARADERGSGRLRLVRQNTPLSDTVHPAHGVAGPSRCFSSTVWPTSCRTTNLISISFSQRCMLPSTIQRLRSSPTWRYAFLAGVASLPLTLALNWQDPSGVWDVSGVALAALAAGYLAKRHGLESTSVGFRTGAIGSLPVLWSVPSVITYVLGLSQPTWFTVLSVVMLAVFVPLVLGFAAVIGALSGRLGGWLAAKSGHPRQPVNASR